MKSTSKTKPDQPALFETPQAEVLPPQKKATAAPKTKAPEPPAKPARKTAVAIRQEQPPAARPDNMLSIIAAAAANPKCDVVKMQALLDMQRQLEIEQARKAFTRSFIDLQSVLPVIRPDGKIEIREKDGSGKRSGAVQQATPYATFQNIMRRVGPLLRQHGFALSFATEPTPDGARVMVKGFLEHIDGHVRTTAFPLPAETSGSKNNLQGWGSTLSYGKRYAAIALLNIISDAKEDKDRDGETDGPKKAGQVDIEAVRKISGKQIDDVRDAIDSCGVGVKKFCEKYGIAAVTDLPESMLADALLACKNYGEHNG